MKLYKKILIGLLVIIVILSGGFLFYVNDYYKANSQATIASNEPGVTIKNDIIELEGTNQDTAFIFYPGAKVEAKAYVPLMYNLKDKGYSSYIVEMPFHLAIFNQNAADSIIETHPEIKNWYLIGHSMGGAMASEYANNNQDKIKGLILLGSYSSSAYPSENILTIYGSNDQVLSKKPEASNNVKIIDGGNHAQFGNYGKQDGDGEATIDNLTQQNETINYILEFIQ